MHNKVIPVAVGILMNEAGHVLLNTRPRGKSFAGYWEFPGGKIQSHETPVAALKRELMEEIGIVIQNAQLWKMETFCYPRHTTVQLYFFLINNWQGTPVAQEKQLLSWQNPQNLTVSPILEANIALMKDLTPGLFKLHRA
ncbi:MAG: 8-oxo-dGTP diphosphatase MutT [Neisseriales bacterium]|nr:MAG: 8-oxo-dGTP diphosphatase MutT [Neisseriales bacterium]